MSELPNISDKHCRKYMRQAKQVGDDMNPCYSRHVGVVIVDPLTGKLLATGYNGPPRAVPHTDDRDYLEHFFWPQLTPSEKATLACAVAGRAVDLGNDSALCKMSCDYLAGRKTCPRKAIGAPSGVRLELCSCAHGEANAIINASANLYGGWMFAHCGIPCQECTKLICQAHLKKLYCLRCDKDYSFGSRWLLKAKGIEVVEHPEEWYAVME